MINIIGSLAAVFIFILPGKMHQTKPDRYTLDQVWFGMFYSDQTTNFIPNYQFYTKLQISYQTTNIRPSNKYQTKKQHQTKQTILDQTNNIRPNKQNQTKQAI